jgi:hypothetical protein
VLAGACGSLDLLQMAGRRRRQHNSIDLGVGEHRFVAIRHTQRMLFREGFDVRRQCTGLQCGKAHDIAAAG